MSGDPMTADATGAREALTKLAETMASEGNGGGGRVLRFRDEHYPAPAPRKVPAELRWAPDGYCRSQGAHSQWVISYGDRAAFGVPKHLFAEIAALVARSDAEGFVTAEDETMTTEEALAVYRGAIGKQKVYVDVANDNTALHRQLAAALDRARVAEQRIETAKKSLCGLLDPSKTMFCTKDSLVNEVERIVSTLGRFVADTDGAK